MTKDLVDFLEEEKIKDEERDMLHKDCKNLVEKKRLEKIISMERAHSSKKIIEINQEIDAKVKQFEDMLRK